MSLTFLPSGGNKYVGRVSTESPRLTSVVVTGVSVVTPGKVGKASMAVASLWLVLGVVFVLWVIVVVLVTSGFHVARHVPRHRFHYRN